MKSDERLWKLIVKRDSGEITSGELKELEYLLQRNETIKAAHTFIEEIWGKGISVADHPADKVAGWKAVHKKINQIPNASKNNKKRFLKRFTVAAAFAAIIVGSVSLYILVFSRKGMLLNGNVKGRNQVSTLLGSRSKVILPDGTKVWLNSGSKLTYNDFSNASTREVTLSGEAFFQVIHDDEQPFIVHTNTIDVKDIGTSFVVKAYPEDDIFEATLIEGAVQVVDRRDTERRILLKPKEKIIIPLIDSLQEPKLLEAQNNEREMVYKIDKVKRDDHGLLPEIAWTQNKLVFNNEPFSQLAKRMERWYNVKICFEDSLIAQAPFTGIIENETLEQALKAMQFSKPFTYLMKDNKVWIK